MPAEITRAMTRTRPDRAEAIRLREFALHCLTRHGALGALEGENVRASLSEMHISRPGSELIAEGARLDKPCLLLDGWGVRQRVLNDGRRQIFSFVLPGDVIGLSARREGTAVCTTVALTEAALAPLPLLAEAVHEEQSMLGHVARDLLSQEESFLYNQVLRLGRQSAHERMISLLLEFHARLQRVGFVRDGSFALPLTQEILSDALGLSVVHTNRTLQQLKREHLIASKGSIISLGNLEQLAEMADWRL
jgi:CRP-like cAMP-binding protein